MTLLNGNGAAWRLFGPQLTALHPRSIFLNTANGTFEGYEKRLPPEAVFHGQKVYFVGSGTIEHLPDGVTLPAPAARTMRLVAHDGETKVHVLEP